MNINYCYRLNPNEQICIVFGLKRLKGLRKTSHRIRYFAFQFIMKIFAEKYDENILPVKDLKELDVSLCSQQGFNKGKLVMNVMLAIKISLLCRVRGLKCKHRTSMNQSEEV